MSWFRVDDTLAAHPKTRRAGLAAMGLWTVSGSWSSQQLTEGFIPDWFVATWPSGKKLARQLVAAGYWEPATDGDDEGWLFHDWTDANPTAEMEKERRRKARDRQRKLRERSAEKREEALDRALEGDVSRSTSRVTYDVSNGAPTRPVPTRPVPEEKNSSRGASHVSSGPGSPPPRFPDHCNEHADVAVPGKCGNCADARKARAAEPTLPDYRLRVVPPLCGECDDRWINTDDGYAHCPRCHPAEVAPLAPPSKTCSYHPGNPGGDCRECDQARERYRKEIGLA